VIGIVLVTVGVLAAGVFNAFSAFWEFIKTIR